MLLWNRLKKQNANLVNIITMTLKLAEIIYSQSILPLKFTEKRRHSYIVFRRKLVY